MLAASLFGLTAATAQDLGGPADAPPPAPAPSLEDQLADLRARLDEQAAQLQSFHAAIGGSADPDEARTLSRAGYVYDNGFVLQGQSTDGDRTFRMRINSWSQFRHTYFSSDGPTADENDFEFERLRFVMSGHVFTRSLTYFTQIDADNDRAQALGVLDYFISYDAGAEWFGLDAGHFGIRAGEWKLPFLRSRRLSGQRLAFTERSMATLFFDIDRSAGVGLYGEADVWSRPLTWEFAMFNGFRTGSLRPGRTGDLDRNFGTSGRVFADLFGEWGEDSESDLVGHDEPAMRIGAAYAVGGVDAEGDAEFSRFRTVDTGAAVADVLPPGANHFLATLFSVDASFKYRGFSFIADYYWRLLSDFGPTPVDDLFDHGFLLHAGYFVVPQKLEMLSRWSRVVGDSSSLGAGHASADEIAFGAAYYIRGHNLKLVFDASHVNGAVLNEPNLNMRPGDIGWYYRTQFQLSF